MHKIRIINQENGEVIAGHCCLADSFFSRLKGLLGKEQMADGEGLLIIPCSSVHTLGMKMDIDVVFLTSDYRVLHIIEGMRPGRISPVVKNSAQVLELPAGKAGQTGLKAGVNLASSAVDD